MVGHLTFFVRCIACAMALVVSIGAGWFAPHQASAALERPDAVAQGGFSPAPFRASAPQAHDPDAIRCALARKWSEPPAQQDRAATANPDAPLDVNAILAQAICAGDYGDHPRACPAGRCLAQSGPSSLQARGPPSLTLT